MIYSWFKESVNKLPDKLLDQLFHSFLSSSSNYRWLVDTLFDCKTFVWPFRNSFETKHCRCDRQHVDFGRIRDLRREVQSIRRQYPRQDQQDPNCEIRSGDGQADESESEREVVQGQIQQIQEEANEERIEEEHRADRVVFPEDGEEPKDGSCRDGGMSFQFLARSNRKNKYVPLIIHDNCILQ